MSVRTTTHEGVTTKVALYDSTSDLAFGPLFDSEEDAEDFLAWLPLDARTYDTAGLIEMRHRWDEIA